MTHPEISITSQRIDLRNSGSELPSGLPLIEKWQNSYLGWITVFHIHKSPEITLITIFFMFAPNIAGWTKQSKIENFWEFSLCMCLIKFVHLSRACCTGKCPRSHPIELFLSTKFALKRKCYRNMFPIYLNKLSVSDWIKNICQTCLTRFIYITWPTSFHELCHCINPYSSLASHQYDR